MKKKMMMMRRTRKRKRKKRWRRKRRILSNSCATCKSGQGYISRCRWIEERIASKSTKRVKRDSNVGDDVEDEESAGPKFFLISSPGPAADHLSHMFGVYHLSEEMREGRSVYIQEHDNTMYGGSPCKLYCEQGVWEVTYDGKVYLRATTTSQSPISVKWEH